MPAAAAPTEMVAAPVPAVCDNVSHACDLLAVQTGFPAPPMLTCCGDAVDPAVALKVREEGLAVTVTGVGAATDSVTETVFEPALLGVDPASLTVIIALYVPAPIPL